MTNKTLAIVVAIPLLLIVLALAGLVRLAEPITSEQQTLIKSIQSTNAAAESIAAGQLTPSNAQIAAVFRATVKSDDAMLKSLESKRSLLISTFWLVVSTCMAHVLICITIFRKQKEPRR
jgi:predicted PurR-regulated permease PerM